MSNVRWLDMLPKIGIFLPSPKFLHPGTRTTVDPGFRARARKAHVTLHLTRDRRGPKSLSVRSRRTITPCARVQYRGHLRTRCVPGPWPGTKGI